MSQEPRPGRYRQAEQHPPDPERVTDVVVTRLEHILEVDPALMTHVQQQRMPVWDSLRIAAARWDHLDDVHLQFADSVTLAGQGPDPELEAEKNGEGA